MAPLQMPDDLLAQLAFRASPLLFPSSLYGARLPRDYAAASPPCDEPLWPYGDARPLPVALSEAYQQSAPQGPVQRPKLPTLRSTKLRKSAKAYVSSTNSPCQKASHLLLAPLV